MKKLGLTLTLLMLVIITSAQTNYYVSLSGADSNTGLSETESWRTISFATSSSSPVSAGDKVYIKAGNYGNENVAVSISGTAIQPIIFEGYQSTPGDNPNLNYTFGAVLDASVMPLLDGQNRSAGGVAITLYAQQYIILKNFQITNYEVGIDGWNASNNILENIIAISLGDYNASYSGKGFSFSPNGSGEGGDNNTLRNCIVSNACAEGISIVGDNNLLEECKVYCDEDNTVHASMDYYIVLAGNSNHVKDCFIERFGDIEHGGAGIGIKEYGEHNLIEDCTAKNLENGCFYVRWEGVKNNEFKNCTAIGTLADVNGFTIRDGASFNEFNSCVSGNCSSAIRFIVSGEDENYCGRNNTFNNCLIKNATWAIEFLSWAIPGPADNNSFVNCTFYNATYLFDAGRENYDNKMINCIVKDVDNLHSGSEALNVEYTYSGFSGNGFSMPAGIGNISADPNFIDEMAGDFHLQAGSPCIDVGTPGDAPDEDFEGTLRPQGSGYDIGAYEYQIPLAVEKFHHLDASLEGSRILLEWTSVCEENTGFFLIERTQNLLDWGIVGRVECASGIQFYRYYKAYDTATPFGQLYYRIKKMDINGGDSYSNIASVFFEDFAFQVYPNPTSGSIFVSNKFLNRKYKIFSSLGIIVKNGIIKTEEINLAELIPGIYILEVIDDKLGSARTTKVILRK